MALNDRVSEESQIQSELRESISQHLERIRELEEELNNRPADNDSSSSEEKEDMSMWKVKFDELNITHESL